MDIKDQHIRNFLRVLAAVVLLVWIYDIVSNKIKEGKIHLDVNDGYVIIGCLAVLLAIEAVRAYVKRKIGEPKKEDNNAA